MDLAHVEETVRYFRPLGFFAALGERTDEQIAAALVDASDAWQGPLSSWSPCDGDPAAFVDLAVLSHDPTRVWRIESWERLHDVAAQAQGFTYCADQATVVASIAAISAHRVELRCVEAAGRSMTITVGARRATFDPAPDGHTLSRVLLARISEALAPDGCELVLISDRFCTGYLLVVSPDDKRRLEAERGWTYYAFGCACPSCRA